MVNDLGKIIVSQIEDLPFIDKLSGIVRTISFKDKQGVLQKIPADCNLNLEDCLKGKRYLDMFPDDKKKSVIFLEDNGTRLINQEGNYSFWSSSIDLVAWFNLPKLGVTECSYSAQAILAIISTIPLVPFNALNTYQYVTINVIGERPKTYNPWAKYTIDETVTQFLMYPYDYFTLQLEFKFRIDKRCIKNANLLPVDNCLKK